MIISWELLTDSCVSTEKIRLISKQKFWSLCTNWREGSGLDHEVLNVEEVKAYGVFLYKNFLNVSVG